MSPANEPRDLGPFEARLAELLPRATDVDRDEVLFEAGRQLARSESRRALRKWQGACGVLLCLAIVPWIQRIERSQPEGGLNVALPPNHKNQAPAPEVPDAPSVSTPVLVHENPAPNTVPPLPESKKESSQVATTRGGLANPWYQLFPKFNVGDPSLALQRQLSIGSSREGTLSLHNLAPRTGGLPSGLDPPLTSMRRDWPPN